jgi:ribosomal protein S18 acetylase RimI-like enzyme
MPHIKPLVPDDWLVLRKVRLTALGDSPDVFLHTLEEESQFSESRWRAEFERGEWDVGFEDDEEPISLLGCTRENEESKDERYLEYLWVARDKRGKGLGQRMLTEVIGRLRDSGVRTAFLWVLDGNEAAVRLYERVGFVMTNYSQPLPGRPERREEKMRLTLS